MNRTSLFKRREFLVRTVSVTTALLWTQISWCFPTVELLGSGGPGYITGYIRRTLQWYSSRFFDFNAHFSPIEKKFVESCIADMRSWGVSLPGHQAFERFRLAHRYSNGKLKHAQLLLGPERFTPRLRSEAEAILRERGVPLTDANDLFALSWDFDLGVFETHRWAKEISLPPVPSVPSELLHSEQMLISSYRHGRLIGTRRLVAYRVPPVEATREVPFGPAVIAVMRSFHSDGTSEWLYRLKGFSLLALPPSVRGPALEHAREFVQLTDFIAWRNENDFILYYP